MTDATQDILTLWERVTNRLVFLEKHYVFHHGDLTLHPSEIHLLLAIRQEPQANATQLAERLGITKGAVSQVLKRLESKGVVTKRSDPSQKNEVTTAFTKLGQKALETFIAERKSTQQRFHKYLSSLGEDEHGTLKRFLKQIDSYLPGER